MATTLACLLLPAVCSGGLALAAPLATPAAAEPAPLATNYDLAAAALGRLPKEPAPRIRANLPDAVPESIEGPVVTWQRTPRGPMLELGALGGGQAWAPGLVHASVDWHF